MIGLLSLSTDLIEVLGRQVIRRAGLRAWCRLTSTCKQLWDMQLPTSPSSWSFDVNDDIRSKSKREQASLAPYIFVHMSAPMSCAVQLYHLVVSRCSLGTAADTYSKQAAGRDVVGN